MNPAPFKNLWVTHKPAFVTWWADLTPLMGQPELLLEWVDEVLAAGERERVYTVTEAPAIGYERGRDGGLSALLGRRFEETGAVDVFDFATGFMPFGERRFRVQAEVAHFDREGEVVRAPVDDLGELLARLRPHDLETGYTFIRPTQPVAIWGATWRPGTRLRALRVQVELASDLWFPWVLGFLEHDQPLETWEWCDNTLLAAEHTPRLNRFLVSLRAVTEGCGGSWALDPDESSRALDFQLHRDGIRLDVRPERVARDVV